MHKDDANSDLPEKPSKSQLKRDMHALQKMGEHLIELADSQLEKIPLPDHLRESIQFARTLKTHESKRRQLQYIGKLMREVDSEPILLALRQIQFQREKGITEFHHIEILRDQLLEKGDEALQKLIELHPTADRQYLRQLIRKAQHDQQNQTNSGASRELFKYLKDLF